MDLITIDGFEAMTRQQLFDASVAHIASTRQKSVREDNKYCSYAGSGCAAAPFIRPECREDADDHGSWNGLYSKGMVPEHEVRLIGKLQRTHDGSFNDGTFMARWKANMRTLAISEGLDTSALDAVVV